MNGLTGTDRGSPRKRANFFGRLTHSRGWPQGPGYFGYQDENSAKHITLVDRFIGDDHYCFPQRRPGTFIHWPMSESSSHTAMVVAGHGCPIESNTEGFEWNVEWYSMLKTHLSNTGGGLAWAISLIFFHYNPNPFLSLRDYFVAFAFFLLLNIFYIWLARKSRLR